MNGEEGSEGSRRRVMELFSFRRRVMPSCVQHVLPVINETNCQPPPQSVPHRRAHFNMHCCILWQNQPCVYISELKNAVGSGAGTPIQRWVGKPNYKCRDEGTIFFVHFHLVKLTRQVIQADVSSQVQMKQKITTWPDPFTWQLRSPEWVLNQQSCFARWLTTTSACRKTGWNTLYPVSLYTLVVLRGEHSFLENKNLLFQTHDTPSQLVAGKLVPHMGADWKIVTIIRWIPIKSCTDICGPQSMDLTFASAPPQGWHLWTSREDYADVYTRPPTLVRAKPQYEQAAFISFHVSLLAFVLSWQKRIRPETLVDDFSWWRIV